MEHELTQSQLVAELNALIESNGFIAIGESHFYRKADGEFIVKMGEGRPWKTKCLKKPTLVSLINLIKDTIN